MAHIEWTDAFEQRLREKLEEDYEQAEKFATMILADLNDDKDNGHR